MAERVQTGGTRVFDYRNEHRSKLGLKDKAGIRKGYAQYHDRRRRERIRKIVFWSIVILAVVILGVLVLR
ncbi:hypothetical protein CMI47_16330 [Candidatus Pacearchaeota archaeon]|nr:hypothetical protein [Candidatus Pacearchaeota archaeon]|tara:strand:- start:1765 stop:1974 length:210 start_codon:yes stop_codon:yes gene_type:complete